MFTATPLPASVTVAGRPAASFVKMNGYPGHSHGTDATVGYVVRVTIDPHGTILWHDETKQACGFDVHAVDGATRYGDALEVVRKYRTGQSYAIIDTLYACGCRS